MRDDDLMAQARSALRTAQANLLEAPDTAAIPIAEALERLAAALDRLADLQGQASLRERNLAAQMALLDERLLRIETNRAFTLWKRIVGTGLALRRRTERALAAMPVRAFRERGRVRTADLLNAEYSKWVAREQASLPSVEEARAVCRGWASQPVISVVVAARETQWLAETLASVQNQVYRNWELCVAAPEDGESAVLPHVRTLEANAGQVRCVVTGAQLNDAGMLHAGAELATGAYLLFARPGDVLSRFALFYLAESLQDGNFDLAYSDEDELDPAGLRTRPKFKPDWSPELLLSCMYAGNLLAVRRERFLEAGGLRSQYSGAHLHDLALRLTDRPAQVRHVARVLYHGRRTSAPEDDRVAALAIEDAIRRREGIAASCVPGPLAHSFVVLRQRREEMAAVICSRSPELLDGCLKSLGATASGVVRQLIVVAHEDSGPNSALRAVIQRAGAKAVSFGGTFNFAAMNNLGAALAETPHLIFLNDDITATAPGWAEMLSEQVSREHVGAAGAVLRYPSGAVQHAGIVVGIGDGLGHAGRCVDSTELWPWLLATREVSAVTGACLAIRTELFRQLGGFDVAFPNNYNDADLCFRVRASGYEVVCVPVTGLIHSECQTRQGIVRFEERYRLYTRWTDVLSQPDPYYSVSLSPTERITLNSGGDRGYRSVLAPEGQ
jgi:GT2 family glycosyltransferase